LKARKRIVNYIYHHTDSLISKTRNKKNARPQKLSVQGREGCLTLPNIWLIGKIAVDIKLVGKFAAHHEYYSMLEREESRNLVEGTLLCWHIGVGTPGKFP